MPQWIDTPAGPQYVDDYGNPAAPPQPGTALPGQPALQTALPGEVATADELAGMQGPPASLPISPLPVAEPALVPQAVVPQVQPGQLPVGPGQSRSVSTGESGFQTSRFNAAAATTGGLKGQQNAARQNAQRGAAEESTWAAAMGGDQARAAQNVGNAEAELEKARSQEFREQANLASMFAAAESVSADLAAQRTAGFRANFEQQLQQASAMRVDPRLNFNKQDTVSAAGLLFVQGFLQAQGTPVFDAQGMVNRLIDRKVDQDMQAIAQGDKLTEGTKMLWDMARTDAADEADARSKYRMLTMAQAASEMEATTAQFNSKLATAKGQAGAADIRAQVNKDLAEITDRHFKRYLAESGLALDEWKTKVQAGQESKRIGIAERDMALREKAASGGPSDLGKDVIFDVNESGERRAKWKFLPGTDDSTKSRLKERMAAKGALISQVRELRGMAAEAGKLNGGWGQAMTNDAFSKRVKALHTGISANYVKAMSGASYTDKDREVLSSRIPLNTILQRDGDKYVREGLSDFVSEATTTTNSDISQFSTDVTPDMPEYNMRGGSPTWASGEDAEADAIRSGRGEVETPTQSALKVLRSPENSQRTIRPTALWTQVGNPTVKEGVANPGNDEDINIEERIPAWAPAMETIFKNAVERDKKWGSKNTEPTPNALEAYRVLQNLKVNSKDPAQADYANDLLGLIDQTVEKSGQRPFSLSDLLDEK